MHRDPTSPSTSRRVGLGLLAAAVLIAAAISPTSAGAGTYVVRECSLGTGQPGVPDAVYSTNGSLAFTPANDCTNQNVGLGIGTQGSFSGPLIASWSFVPPAGATINSVNFQRSSRSAGTYSALVSVCQPDGSCNGLSNDTPGAGFTGAQFSPGGWTSFSSILQCGATCNAGGWVYLKDIEFTMLDPTKPTIASLGGDLVAGGERRGVERLIVDAADQGGGVTEVSVRVNGAEVIARPQNTCEAMLASAYGRMRPCGNAHFEVPIDTEIAPWEQGSNLLEVCAYDLTTSGAPNSGCVTRTVVAENSCQATGGGAAATGIDGGLQKGTGPLAPEITVLSTEGATVRGNLAGPAGSASAANVCLYETVNDGSSTKRELTQIGKTKSDGTFAVQVPAGPSRKLDLVYRFNNKVISKPNLLLNAVVVPTLQVSPTKVRNRQRVFFRGDLPGPNNTGRRVALQAQAGKKWRTFKTIKTDEKGRFKGLYRFTSTQGRVTYKFRAQVKRQAGYPYERGVSAKRKVVVIG